MCSLSKPDICHDGLIVSRMAAIRLFEKVLDHDDVELAGELTRFLGPLNQSPSLSHSSKISSQDSPTLSESDEGITDREVYCIRSLFMPSY